MTDNLNHKSEATIRISPYQINVSEDGSLEIRLNAGRERYLRNFYLIAPVLFLSIAIISLFLYKDDIPWIFMLVPIISLYLSFALFNNSWFKSVHLDRHVIRVSKVRFYKETVVTYDTFDIDAIRYYFVSGRGGGYFYTLELKRGKAEQILAIPLWDSDKEKAKALGEMMSAATNLPLEKGD